MIEERLQQIVEAEQRARETEKTVLREVADLQGLRQKAREEADQNARVEVAAHKALLESRLEERIQSDLKTFRDQYEKAKKTIEHSARANQDALTTWLWEEVIRQYGCDADAKTPAGHDA